MHLDHPLHHLHSNLHLSEANQQVLTSKRTDYLRKFSNKLLKPKDPKVNSFSTAGKKKIVSRIFSFRWCDRNHWSPEAGPVEARVTHRWARHTWEVWELQAPGSSALTPCEGGTLPVLSQCEQHPWLFPCEVLPSEATWTWGMMHPLISLGSTCSSRSLHKRAHPSLGHHHAEVTPTPWAAIFSLE